MHKIEKSTQLSEFLASTILLKPLSREDIKKEILKRHKIGGLSLHYKSDMIESEREDRHISRLFNRIHRITKGNMGHAFLLWLNAIETNDAGEYTLVLPPKTEFPDIHSQDWINVLLQLLLHKSLSKDRFRFLYKSMGDNWIEKIERELNTSLILDNPGMVSYTLKKMLRIHLEDYLTEKHIL